MLIWGQNLVVSYKNNIIVPITQKLSLLRHFLPRNDYWFITFDFVGAVKFVQSNPPIPLCKRGRRGGF
jgi:hypothetical protein